MKNPEVRSSEAHLRLRQGAQDKGTRFLFLMTRNCPSGERAPALDEVVDGGVGDISEDGSSQSFCAMQREEE